MLEKTCANAIIPNNNDNIIFYLRNNIPPLLGLAPHRDARLALQRLIQALLQSVDHVQTRRVLHVQLVEVVREAGHRRLPLAHLPIQLVIVRLQLQVQPLQLLMVIEQTLVRLVQLVVGLHQLAKVLLILAALFLARPLD